MNNIPGNTGVTGVTLSNLTYYIGNTGILNNNPPQPLDYNTNQPQPYGG